MKLKLLFALLTIISISNAQTQIGQSITGSIDAEQFGSHVTISADGSTLAGSTNPINGSNIGHVRIFKNILGNWIQIGSDIIIETVGAGNLGFNVSLSFDGNIVAVAESTLHNNGMLGDGLVRIYKNLSGNWTQIGNNIYGEAPFDNSRIVSLSSDGNIVAIGALFNGANGLQAGHVRIFENIAGIWTQIGQDIDGEAAGDESGFSISLSSDGSIIAIGAPRNNGNGHHSGHVRLYKNISGVWTQIGQDIDGEATGDSSGVSISLSSDGSIIAIGATGNSKNGFNSGHVRVYKNLLGIWTKIGQDIYGEAVENYSGHSVSLSANGDILVIGTPKNNANGYYSGHVRIYKNIAGAWTQIGKDINGQLIDEQCGWSVSLSADGNLLVIGCPFYSSNISNSDGQVRVFNLSSILSSDTFVLENFNIYPNPTTDILNIELKENLTLEKVLIYNTSGQLVKETFEKTINVSGFAKGIYNVQVLTNHGKATKKVIFK